ncbi:MAG: DUF1287 domain-containing protein [Bacteroidetes bacterium]|nr:DUF1287 domain-containing protein [Bacteroidota bacterium]
MRKIIISIFLNVFILLSCNKKSDTAENLTVPEPDSLKSGKVTEQSLLQRKIIEGAEKNLSEQTEYDMTMGYYVLTFKNGKDMGKKVYPEGDLDPAVGVCTDVIIRSLRYGGICDLQKELHEDIISARQNYPFSRWGNKKPDTNIDHRRVMNLEVWFSRYWDSPGNGEFIPGDIVVWDMDQDGASDHIGIVSDNFTGQRYKVIHNHPDPGHIAEEDKLFHWEISGHYRIRN